ncbi:MAG: leucine-rich repeat domain-containing protein [Paludibacteraceae bacterium]|nr:leucine-rich repeat domain-containing protein [Paludibacteraceae bacterium]
MRKFLLLLAAVAVVGWGQLSAQPARQTALSNMATSAASETSWTIGPDNLLAVFNAEDSTLTITGQGAIPDNLLYSDNEYYSWRADNRHKVAHLIIGDEVTYVGSRMFEEYNNLRDVVLGAAVDTIADRNFTNCRALSSLTIRSNQLYIGDFTFDYTAFADTLDLTHVVGLGVNVFTDCSNLKGAYLPDLEGLVIRAFTDCPLFDYIYAPKLTALGPYAFLNCPLLERLELPALDSLDHWAFYMSTIAEMEFPNLRVIGDQAFYNCSNLSHFTFGEHLERIGSQGFYYCNNLKHIVVNAPETAECPWNGLYGIYPDTIIANTMFVLDTWGRDMAVVIPANDQIKEAYRNFGYFFEDHDSSFDFLVLDPTALDTLAGVNNHSLLLDYSERLGDHVGALLVNNATTAHFSRFCKRDFNGESTWARWNDEMRWNPSDPQIYFSRYYTSLQTALVNEGNLTADEVVLRESYSDRSWVFTSLPFDVPVNDFYTNADVFIALRHFDPALQAQGHENEAWVDYEPGEIIPAHTPFIFQHYDDRDVNVPYEFEFTAPAGQQNNIFVNSDQTLSLSHHTGVKPWLSNWNLLANPFPAFYNAREMGSDGLIGVFLGAGKDGGYTFLSLRDDYYVLQPGESFLYQARNNEQSIAVPASGRRMTARPDQVSNMGDNDSGAPCAPARNHRTLINIRVSGNELTDACRIVLNESASMDYEQGVDAPKLTFGSEKLLLSSSMGEAQLAINERPYDNGSVLLNLSLRQSGDYTITLDQEMEDITLIDHLSNVETVLTAAGYTFYATPGNYTNRFELRFGAPQAPTAVENIEAEETLGEVYTLTGQKVGDTSAKGIYIIRRGDDVKKVLNY